MLASEPPIQDFSLWSGLKVIYGRISPSRRRQLFLVILLMSAGALAEVATIGAVIPFLALLTDGSGARQQAWLRWLPTPLSRGDPLDVAATVFIALAILAGLVRLQLSWSSRHFIFRLGHELTVELQRRVLFQPFSFHIHRNTSTVISSLNKNETLVFDVLLPLMQAVGGSLFAVVIVAILLVVAPLTTLLVAGAFVLIYAVISVMTRKKLADNSALMDTAFDERLRLVQESLGGIRDVIIDHSQSMYLREFTSIDNKLANARATTQFISIAPRYLIETIGMIMIAAIAIFAARRVGGTAAALPVLGALALGAQRLLPLVQEAYGSWSRMQGQRSIFAQIIELLCLPVSERPEHFVAPLDLRRAIAVENVSFSYPTRAQPAIDQLSLSIPRGSMLAIVGATGSGKSTFLDVLMGLLTPEQGRILIDDTALSPAKQRRWHRSIGHVPQTIFLADSTIARNIALSLPDSAPDQQRIVDAAKKAQLHNFILSLPAGYETLVGERGVRLSGGQQQRVGIARAIYKNAPILILDEATSALDDTTEADVITALKELQGEGRTIVIVAHRLSTIRHCDVVARLDHGRLAEFGSFDEVVGAQENLA